MRAHRKASRRSQSPRFRTFRSTFSALSNRTARSLTDVTLQRSPSSTPDIPETFGTDAGATTDHAACVFDTSGPTVRSANNAGMSEDTQHSSQLKHVGENEPFNSAFRPRSSTISDTSPATYLTLHHKLHGQPEKKTYCSNISDALPPYLTVDEVPEFVQFTSVDELRSCHERIRCLKMTSLESSMRDGERSNQSTLTRANVIAAATLSIDSGNANAACSSDGVFQEDDQTPVPSPDLLHSTPMHESLPPAPYIIFYEHEVSIVPDRYGYGMVVSGSCPCYVSRVEALGPAYQAGLHVGDFVLNANGIDVLNCDHEEIAQILLQDTSTAHLVILSVNSEMVPAHPTIFNHPLGNTQLNQRQRRADDSLLSQQGCNSAVSVETEESCVVTDSFIRPDSLAISEARGASALTDGMRDPKSGSLRRRQSRSSLQSQSAPVSPVDRDDKRTLLVLSQCVDSLLPV